MQKVVYVSKIRDILPNMKQTFENRTMDEVIHQVEQLDEDTRENPRLPQFSVVWSAVAHAHSPRNVKKARQDGETDRKPRFRLLNMKHITHLTVELYDGTLVRHDFPGGADLSTARAKAHAAYNYIPTARTIALWTDNHTIFEFVVQSTDGLVG